MKDKLEKFWLKRLEVASHFLKTKDILNNRAISYGALMFCLENKLIDFDAIYPTWEIIWNKYQELLKHAK